MSGSTATAIDSAIKAVAIGNFDGMHRGHQVLFEHLGDEGGVVVIEHFRSQLTPGIYRADYCDTPLFYYDFERIRPLTPEAFVEKLYSDFPNLEKIVVGEDFCFGLRRSGDAKRLESLFDGKVEIVQEVKLDKEGIHSQRIREMISQGEIERAVRFLGHAYRVWGRVVRGQGIGSKALVPTINLRIDRFLLPKAGVYATKTKLDEAWYPSVTFVGHRHTTDGRFAVETHIVDGWRHSFEKVVEVGIAWERRIRENRRFDSLAALKAQITKDIGVVCGR